MTKQHLRDELKKAMLAKDSEKVSVMRMLLAAIQSYETKINEAEYDKKVKEAEKTNTDISQDEQVFRYEVSEEDVMVVLQKEVKQHRDSIAQFKAAGRDELVEKEEKELKMLEVFLPAQMGENEIKKLVVDAVAKSGASSPADMGKVMRILMPHVKDKADGTLVSKLVKDALNN
jgi:uncharacterized protein YqeY